MKKILIVDGNSILNRAFYGIRALSTRDGMPTNAVYGIFTILSKHISMVSPDYCVIAFDLKAPTFRHNMYTGYKANRKPMPDELAVQLPFAKECVQYMGFELIEREGYEADDVLGTVSRACGEEGIHSYLLTGDRDSLQLISDNTTVLLATNKDTVRFDREHFISEYGITPEQFVDVKALMGDSSDNIPGVAGIGEKTALKLIADFSSISNLYETYEGSTLTASVKNKLASGKESAFMSKTLATIERNAPIDFSPQFCEYNGFDKRALCTLFEKLEFSSLIKKYQLDNFADEEENISSEMLDASESAHPIPDIPCRSLSLKDTVNACKGKKIAISIADNVLSLYDGEALITAELSEDCADILLELLECSEIICYNSKELYKYILSKNINANISTAYFDVMLGAYVLNSTRRDYGLDRIYLEYVGESLSDKLDHGVAAYKIFETMLSKIKEEGAEHLLFDIEIPLALVLADMETVGVKVDSTGISEYGKELSQIAADLKERIYCAAGEEFNIDSTRQLADVLFNKLGLPAQKKTKTGYSTDAETLNKLKSKYPIIEDILDYRQVTKLISTYTEGLLKVCDENSKIHTLLNQTGTATGRLSSAEPNLQNIPVRTELGRRFRKYFIASDADSIIIDADYSQIELRLLAAISDDTTMISAFKNGEDIHTSTASKVFDVPVELVTPELRKRAKAVNFGIVYGIGEHSLSEDLGISRVQAKQYIESYLNGFPYVNDYLVNIKKQAREDGYVSTLFGRRRYIAELSVANKNIQHFGERVAMNSPIQGTAADIIKIAMINVYKRFKSEGVAARLILQVHDELLVEAKKDCAKAAKKILAEEMENAVKLTVPLDVDVGIGETWYDAKR